MIVKFRIPVVTRRDAAKGLFAAAGVPLFSAGARDQHLTLQNSAIEFRLTISRGRVLRRSFTNRMAGERFLLPAEDFAFTFADGGKVSPASLSVEVAGHDDSHLELIYQSPQGDLEARVQYDLPAGKAYMRKRIAVRRQGTTSPRLMNADLENWDGVRRAWTSMKADSLPYGSHPIFCETVWVGVEFVAAFNQYGPEGVTLRSRPGGVEVGPDWVSLHPTIAGVAEPGRVRDGFLQYLEDIRAAPARLVACYNSWWTLPSVVKQEDNLNLIRILKEKLRDRHGVFFDIVTTDMGWSDPRSIWEIDRTQLPNGFDDIRGIVESAHAHLGVWMSPSEMYPPVCDYEWLEKAGYVVLRHTENRGQKPFALSLADPKYRSAVTGQLSKLIDGTDLWHIKYDGFVAEEPQGHHDLLPGPDSVEPLAHYLLDLLDNSKKANPNLVTEPTCLNSLANFISPWIIQHSDSVWGNAGGDCPPGMNPAPDYRESQTNAREYYIFSSLREFWLPQNAVQYFDIVHCDQASGFPNHAAMAFGRGRFFVPTYLNPRFMTDDDWRIYAGLLKWARANQEILRNTTVIPSRVEIGEPYVYAHWQGRRGILAIRNPSNATRDFNLDLGTARAPKSLSQAVCYAQYPYRKGIAKGLNAGSTISLKLAPWELLFLEIVPEPELYEPVAIGARWYSESGRTKFAADRESGEVQWLEPRSAARSLRVSPRTGLALRGHVMTQSAHRAPGDERFAMKSVRVPTTAFEMECEVSIPAEAIAGRLLLLLEYPGTKFWPSRCGAMLDGKPVSLVESSSALQEEGYPDGHIGYHVVTPGGPNSMPSPEPWKEARQYQSQWSWYECAVPAGSSRVHFSGACGCERPQVGVWLWSEERVDRFAHILDSACSSPAMPQYREDVELDGICLRPSSGIL